MNDLPSSLKYLTGVTLDSLQLPSLDGLSKSKTTPTRPGQTKTLPPRYSTHDAHPQCKFLVRNQGKCGSCWAETAADVLTDRMCIAQGLKVPLSSQPMVSCAGIKADGQAVMTPFNRPECIATQTGDDVMKCACSDLPTAVPPLGCQGNSMEAAWNYLKTYGTIPMVDFGPSSSNVSCQNMCLIAQGFPAVQESIYLSLKNSKIPASTSLTDENEALHNNIAAMKQNLMEFGPIQGAFSVYQSFYDFFDKNPTGVYQMQPEGKPIGGHTSKIIGWDVAKDDTQGVPQGTPYWILQNTWGTEWGDKGFYKMAMTQAKDLEALTSANAFVIEYNAMASMLAMGASVKEVLTEKPVKPKQFQAKSHVWLWVGVGITSLLLVGLVAWLVVKFCKEK